MTLRNIFQIINVHCGIIKSEYYTSSEKKVSYGVILNAVRNFSTETLDEHLSFMNTLNGMVNDTALQPIRADIKKIVMSFAKLDLTYHEEVNKNTTLEKKAISAIKQHLNKLQYFKDKYHDIHFVENPNGQDRAICCHMKSGETFRHNIGSRSNESIIKFAAKIAFRMTEEYYKN